MQNIKAIHRRRGGVTLPSRAEFNAFQSRVLADSGTIRNQELAKALVKFYKSEGRLANIKLGVNFEAGVLIRDASPYKYATKGFSFDATPNNLAQSTASWQPYLCGFIAPNERYGVLNPQNGTKLFTHNAISFAANEAWTVSVLCNLSGYALNDASSISGKSGTTRLGFLASGNTYIFQNESSGSVGGSDCKKIIGKICKIDFVANGLGTVAIYENGSIKGTFTISSNIVLINLLQGRYHNFYGKIYHYLIQSGAITASQALAEYNFLRAYYPEIETVQIGTQQWATSNLDIVTTPMGTLIPEVTDNSAWAALTTPAWCHYNNDPANGAIYGKLYNWYAVKQIQDDITAYNAANPSTPWGYHIPTQAELTTLQTYLGGSTVAGGKMKVRGTTYFASPNTGATNESGFSALGASYRNETNGTFYSINTFFVIFAIDQVSANNGKLFYVDTNNDDFLSVNMLKSRGVSIRLIKD